MASTARMDKGKGTETTPQIPSNFTSEQLEQIIAKLTGGTKKPRIKEPSVFHGERDMYRGWIAQLTVYFRGVGWEEEHDQDKNVYALSLLRGDALKWATPYVEGRQEATWGGWTEFKEELRKQFGEIDEQGSARAKLMKLSQGTRTATEYWNEFRLVASQTGMDDATLTFHLMKGFRTDIQDAWGMDGSDSQETQYVANWAIKKETKMASIRHMRMGNGQKEKTTHPTTRNQDGTFRQQTVREDRGDPMELDATRRRGNFGLSTTEFRRRMRDKLCLKCGKPGHRAAECRSQPNNKEGASWQPRNKTPWAPKPKIREMKIEEEEPEQSGNEESPQ